MNNTLKVILACITGLTLICMIVTISGYMMLRSTGRALARTLNTDSHEVAQISGAIADYSLPDGFGNAFATDVAGISFVSYTGADQHSHIYLFQLPSFVSVDQDELYRQFGQAAGESGASVAGMELVEQRPGTICGQDVTLVVNEGLNGDNQAYRQVSALFDGRGGQAMVMVSGPVATWDQAMVDDFLASLQP